MLTGACQVPSPTASQSIVRPFRGACGAESFGVSNMKISKLIKQKYPYRITP
jgi:hypothetical protein